VFFNTSNEEHTGTSRLWVELARRWAGDGVRCVRFDLTGVGDSPDFPAQPTPVWYEQEWLEDVEDVVRELQPQDPANTILIGLCSGAYYAAEGALAFGARGACLLNPPAGTDLLHAAATFRKSRLKSLSRMATLLKVLHLRHPWLGIGMWQILRVFLPRRYSEDLMATASKEGTSLLVVSTIYDLSPYPHIPLLRSIDQHRVAKPRNYLVDFVPDLDHAMHNPEARELVTAALDSFLREQL
jgi:pimeloyl-ACP methyl ester carboxylesterase